MLLENLVAVTWEKTRVVVIHKSSRVANQSIYRSFDFCF